MLARPGPSGPFSDLAAYREGHAAFEAGQERSANPYHHIVGGAYVGGHFVAAKSLADLPPGTVTDAFAWTLGFNQAKADFASTD